jgi:hypothetical protein
MAGGAQDPSFGLPERLARLGEGECPDCRVDLGDNECPECGQSWPLIGGGDGD